VMIGVEDAPLRAWTGTSIAARATDMTVKRIARVMRRLLSCCVVSHAHIERADNQAEVVMILGLRLKLQARARRYRESASPLPAGPGLRHTAGWRGKDRLRRSYTVGPRGLPCLHCAVCGAGRRV
jgi:hypothetical protein